MTVFHRSIPADVWDAATTRELPGVSPVSQSDLLRIDEIYAQQMKVRDYLISECPNSVLQTSPEALSAVQEALEFVLVQVRSKAEFHVSHKQVARPDGEIVAIDWDAPLLTIGRLIQEDFCLLQKTAEEHVLTGAALCFPAGWTLSEKIGRPLLRIHRPVASYDDVLGRRVQRMFDGLKIDRPIWRANALIAKEAELFAPRPEASADRGFSVHGAYLRSERQTLFRLPNCKAIAFAIHTYLIPISELSEDRQLKLQQMGKLEQS
ncbi:MAG: DUF3445 domain-containing protein [Boseongicola sp.]|nr:MAG: DUF3445 domain-containing protein [Boseongicola sp.]